MARQALAVATTQAPQFATVGSFLEEIRKRKRIDHRAFGLAVAQLDIRAPISNTTAFLIDAALGERVQHGTGGTPVDDALLIINTIRSATSCPAPTPADESRR